MKILLIEYCNFDDYPIGGYLTFAKQMAKAFKCDFYAVGVSTDNDEVGVWKKKDLGGSEFNFMALANVPKLTKRPLIPLRLQAYFLFKRNERKIYAQDFDIVFVQTPEALFSVPHKSDSVVLARIPGLENPLRISRYWFAKYFAAIFQILFFRGLRLADHILATGDTVAVDYFANQLKGYVSQEKVVKFPSRFDESIFFPSDMRKCRTELNLDPQAVVVVTAGRISELKGWSLILDAFESFRLSVSHAKLIFVGDGEDRVKLERAVENCGLGKSVTVTGSVNHVKLSKYLNAADLYVSGSLVEGWSTSLMEAVACATPVVVTDFSSANELVDHGLSGFVCNRREPEAFAELMLRALDLDRDALKVKAKEVSQFGVGRLREAVLSFENKVQVDS